MTLLFPAKPAFTVPTTDGATFPVHRIFCVGRNYADHAKEMGVEVDREAPFYFTKSAAHGMLSGGTLPYPQGTENFHYEMELAVFLGPDGPIGAGCALDMTRRDLQIKERKKERPWSLGKDVEGSAVFGPLTLGYDIADQTIALSQNGIEKQNATLSDMVWSVPEIHDHLSGFYHLGAGDVILTGTPAGVGPVQPGDRLDGHIDGLAALSVTIGPEV